jgi:excisionase family DNA binding protein
VREEVTTTTGKIMLTPDEAAAYVGVGRTKFYELVRQRLIVAVHHGPQLVRYHVRDLDEYLDRKRQEARAS